MEKALLVLGGVTLSSILYFSIGYLYKDEIITYVVDSYIVHKNKKTSLEFITNNYSLNIVESDNKTENNKIESVKTIYLNSLCLDGLYTIKVIGIYITPKTASTSVDANVINDLNDLNDTNAGITNDNFFEVELPLIINKLVRKRKTYVLGVPESAGGVGADNLKIVISKYLDESNEIVINVSSTENVHSKIQNVIQK